MSKWACGIYRGIDVAISLIGGVVFFLYSFGKVCIVTFELEAVDGLTDTIMAFAYYTTYCRILFVVATRSSEVFVVFIIPVYSFI